MNCENCNSPIELNANFCSNCGNSQEKKQDEPLIKNTLNNNLSRNFTLFYLIWLLIHLILLLIFSGEIFSTFNSEDGLEDFWPFDGFRKCDNCNFAKYYDFTEFIFYLILPFIIIFIKNLTEKKNSKN